MPKIVQDGRQHLRMYPLPKDGASWLYAFGLGGRTKIGMTRNPRCRAISHWQAQRGGIEWFHLFAPVPVKQCWLIERTALALAELGSVREFQTEWFQRLSKAEAIACVRDAIKHHMKPAVAKPEYESTHQRLPRGSLNSRAAAARSPKC